MGGASGMKDIKVLRSAPKSHKAGCLMRRAFRYERYQVARISAKSHKAGSLMSARPGMKDIRVPGSAQNVKRQKIFTDERRIKNKNSRGGTMLQAGQKRELTVVKETNFGVYLAEEEHSKDKVLLPKKEAETIKCGDKVSVFLYLDSSDRPDRDTP